MSDSEWFAALNDPARWDVIGIPGSELRIEWYAKRIADGKPLFDEE